MVKFGITKNIVLLYAKKLNTF